MPFNRAAWDGEKPLVEPMRAPIQVGSVIWESAPDDTEYERRGGIVLAAKRTDDGEQVLTVMRATKRDGRFHLITVDLNGSEVDGSIVEPPSTFRLHRAAREICRYLGTRPGAFIAGHDLWLYEAGYGLVALTGELTADAAAALAKFSCPHGDRMCPCNDGDVCNYVDWEGTKAARCPRTGTFDCDCEKRRARLEERAS